MNSISELTQLSQTQYQPQMSGAGAGVGNLGQGQIRQKQTFNLGNTNADKLAKELANMVGSVQDFTEKQIQFSDDAIKRVAIDHTLSLEEEITAIDADPELSFDEKRKRIGDATNKLYTASGKIISDEPRSQQIYDDIFTGNARKLVSKSMAKIDIEENKYNLNKELEYAQEILDKSPETVTVEALRTTLSSNLKQQTISEDKVRDMVLATKVKHIKNKYDANPDSFFTDGKLNESIIEEVFSDFKNDERTYAKETIGSTIAEIKSSYSKLEAARIKDRDDKFQLAVKESFVKDKSISNIELLYKEVTSAVKEKRVSSDTGLTLQIMLETKLDKVRDDRIKKYKSETDQFLDRKQDEMKFKETDKKIDIDNLIHLYATPEGQTEIEGIKNTIKARYSDEPEKMKNQLYKLDEIIKKNSMVAYEIQEGRNQQIVRDSYSEQSKTALKKEHTSDLLGRMDSTQLTFDDMKAINKDLNILNKIPDEVEMKLMTPISTGNPNDFNNTYNFISSAIQAGETPNDRAKNMMRFKNNKIANAILLAGEAFTDPKTGEVNAEGAIMAVQKLIDPENQEYKLAITGISKAVKDTFSNQYSPETIEAVTEHIAMKSLLGGTPIKDMKKEFTETIKERSYNTDDYSAIDIKGQYTDETFETVTEFVKHMNPNLKDGKLVYDINPMTGGVKATVNGYVLFSSADSTAFQEYASLLSIAKKEYDTSVEYIKEQQRLKEQEQQELDNKANPSINPLGNNAYSNEHFEEGVKTIKGIGSRIYNKVDELKNGAINIKKSIIEDLEEMYIQKMKNQQSDSRADLIRR